MSTQTRSLLSDMTTASVDCLSAGSIRHCQGCTDSQTPLLQLVQRQPKARDKGVEKVAHFRECQGVDAGSERLLSLRELRIPGSSLLQTLEVGTQLVRGCDQVVVHAVGLVRRKESLIIGL